MAKRYTYSDRRSAEQAAENNADRANRLEIMLAQEPNAQDTFRPVKTRGQVYRLRSWYRLRSGESWFALTYSAHGQGTHMVSVFWSSDAMREAAKGYRLAGNPEAIGIAEMLEAAAWAAGVALRAA